MQRVRRRTALDDAESEPLLTSETTDTIHQYGECLSSRQCAMTYRKTDKSTNISSIELPDTKASRGVSSNLIHAFLAFMALIALAILILLIVTTVNVSRMRNELNEADHRTAEIIAHKMTKFYEKVRLMQLNSELGNESSQLPDFPVPVQLSQLKAANIPPIQETGDGISPTYKDWRSEETGNTDRIPSWHNRKCSTIRCKRNDIDRPPVVVISLDGFSKRYIERHIVKTLDFMAECGASAKFMYPSFPSKTFPNHYSMATGLYPESHGIVDNNVHAPEFSKKLEYVPKTNDPRYFKGEPIWAIAERKGLRSACLFWTGCWQNVSGISPTYNMRYNRSFNFRQRADKIIEWLSLPKDQRPHLIMAYFSQPDNIGHFHKSEKEINIQLAELDHLLNYLFSSLHSKDLLNCANILIVSDHGMQKLEKRYYLNEYINTDGLVISSGVVARIEIIDSKRTQNELQHHLRCINNGTQYKIYDKKHIPKRYHYAGSNRIGDLVLEAVPGVTLFANKASDIGVVADHGYDYLVDSMHTIFYARGPNIMPKLLLEPFQNIEIFNLLTDLLDLANVFPNNGTYGRLHEVLVNSPKGITGRQSTVPYACPARTPFRPSKVTSCDVGCESIAKEITSSLSECQSITPFGIFGFSPDVISYCYMFLCSVTVLTSTQRFQAQPLAIYEPLSVVNLQKPPSTVFSHRCTVVHDQFKVNCEKWNAKRRIASTSQMQYHGLLASAESSYNSVDRVQALLFNSFINGPFMYLQNLTLTYARKYERLTVITGTIFDYDNNGLADSADVFKSRERSEGLLSEQPSHIFRILLRCADRQWSADGHTCYDALNTRILAFILPNTPDDLNCLKPMDYLFANTARIRDIELLTGLEFFIDRNRYSANLAIQLRTHIIQNLWYY